MSEHLLIALDQGTTSSRVILFSTKGEIITTSQRELPLICPEDGWVEQDALVIWHDMQACLHDVLQHERAQNAALVIGITNQRETIVVWDKQSGKPVYNAIVWQDRRTADTCADLKKQGLEPEITAKTGLLLDPYFSATKLAWVLDNIDGARAKAGQGQLLAGTIDSWLIWNLTGGARHVTDATNASRTLLFDITTQQWDDQLLQQFNVPRTLLPDVLDCAADFGMAEIKNHASIPIRGVAGDQQAALLGQACTAPGMVKSTYGTGCFALMHIGDTFKVSSNRLLTTVAYRIDGQTSYAIEGSIFVAGAAIQWLRDGLGLFAHASESEAIARSVADSGGVVFVPAFTGLGAPYWDAYAKAAIFGLRRDTKAAHIVRAALEAQALQTLDLVSAMQADTGQTITRLRADGGLVANKLVCQMLADILQIPIDIPVVTETTALGAALLAGLGAGIYPDLAAFSAVWKQSATFEPQATVKDVQHQRDLWRQAVGRLQHS